MNSHSYINPLTVDDIESVFDIRDSVKENHKSREAVAELGFTPASFKAMLAGSCFGWIAFLDAVPVGFVVVDKADAKVLGLFIKPEAEGRGLGRQLLSTAEAFLADEGITEAWLTTSADKTLRAHRFYEQMGWKICEALPNDQVKYKKSLC